MLRHVFERTKFPPQNTQERWAFTLLLNFNCLLCRKICVNNKPYFYFKEHTVHRCVNIWSGHCTILMLAWHYYKTCLMRATVRCFYLSDLYVIHPNGTSRIIVFMLNLKNCIRVWIKIQSDKIINLFLWLATIFKLRPPRL